MAANQLSREQWLIYPHHWQMGRDKKVLTRSNFLTRYNSEGEGEREAGVMSDNSVTQSICDRISGQFARWSLFKQVRFKDLLGWLTHPVPGEAGKKGGGVSGEWRVIIWVTEQLSNYRRAWPRVMAWLAPPDQSHPRGGGTKPDKVRVRSRAPPRCSKMAGTTSRLLLVTVWSALVLCLSAFLNIEELNEMKYGIEILSDPIIKGQVSWTVLSWGGGTDAFNRLSTRSPGGARGCSCCCLHFTFNVVYLQCPVHFIVDESKSFLFKHASWAGSDGVTLGCQYINKKW